MNILLLSDELMPGGVARHIVDLANSIKKRGVNVYLSTTPGEYKNRLNPEISYLPISILIENSFVYPTLFTSKLDQDSFGGASDHYHYVWPCI